MKRPIHTIIMIFVFSFLLNMPQLFAAFCQSNGGGEWSDENTWLRGGVPGIPEAGDIIIIAGADLVTISSTVDLGTGNDGTPTSIVIFGILKFWSPEGNCPNNICDIDLILDTGSEIDVQSVDGIQEEGPGIGQKDIMIGGESVLGANEWPFGPGILPQAPLPVELVSFVGVALKNSILLKWQTGSEESSKEFILERSATGRDDFVEIGTVAANGFSNDIQNYEFEDKNPLVFAYYRLRIVDFDNSYKYSEIIALEKAHVGISNFEVFPVPFENMVNIWINSDKNANAILTLSNYLGQVVLNEHLDLNEGENKFRFNWDILNSNLYFIIIETDQERLVKKVF